MDAWKTVFTLDNNGTREQLQYHYYFRDDDDDRWEVLQFKDTSKIVIFARKRCEFERRFILGHFQMVTSSAINLEFSVKKIVKMKGVLHSVGFTNFNWQTRFYFQWIFSSVVLCLSWLIEIAPWHLHSCLACCHLFQVDMKGSNRWGVAWSNF